MFFAVCFVLGALVAVFDSIKRVKQDRSVWNITVLLVMIMMLGVSLYLLWSLIF